MTTVPAGGGGEGTADIEESVVLEGLRKQADVLEVNNPDTASRNVEEEVVLGDVGVIDGGSFDKETGGVTFFGSACGREMVQ